jgi:hypothetical protein
VASITLPWNDDCDDLTIETDTANFEQKSGCSVSTANPKQGTAAIRISFTGVQGDHGMSEVTGSSFELAYGFRFFTRSWVRVSPGMTWFNNNTCKCGRWTFNGQASAEDAQLLTLFYGKNLLLQLSEHSFNTGFTTDQGIGSGGDGPNLTGWNIDPATNPAVTDWHEYITEFQIHSGPNATDGYTKCYVDGNLIDTVTGIGWWGGTTHNNRFATYGAKVAEGVHFLWTHPQTISSGGWIEIDDVGMSTVWNSTEFAQGNGGIHAVSRAELISIADAISATGGAELAILRPAMLM